MDDWNWVDSDCEYHGLCVFHSLAMFWCRSCRRGSVKPLRPQRELLFVQFRKRDSDEVFCHSAASSSAARTLEFLVQRVVRGAGCGRLRRNRHMVDIGCGQYVCRVRLSSVGATSVRVAVHIPLFCGWKHCQMERRSAAKRGFRYSTHLSAETHK